MMSIILCYLLLFELKRVMTLHVHVQACTCSIDFEKKAGGGGLVQKILTSPGQLVTSLSLFVSLFLRQLFTWSQKSGGQLLDNSLKKNLCLGGGGS